MRIFLRLRPSPSMAVAMTALLIALGGTAIAATHLVNGDSLIKKGSLSGNRLRNKTVAGKQIKLSALGTIPNASHATNADHAVNAVNAANAAALAGHPASDYALNSPLSFTAPTLSNSWANSTTYSTSPAGYAKDALGIVHLRGALTGGTSDTVAFTLPAGMRPAGNMWLPIYTFGGTVGSLAIQSNGNVIPFGSQVTNFASLDGVSFPAG